MSKATPTRREAPRNATAEDSGLAGPELLSAANDYTMKHDIDLARIVNGDWAPAASVEMVATIKYLAGSIDYCDRWIMNTANSGGWHGADIGCGRGGIDDGADGFPFTLPTLRDHVQALEATIYGAAFDDHSSQRPGSKDVKDNSANRALIRLSLGEDRPEGGALMARIADLEARLAALEGSDGVVRREHFDARINELLQAVTSNA